MKTWKTESFEMLFGYPVEAERAKKEEWPILIPVGTMEYHSHHCPYGCDSLVAIGLANRIADEVNCVVMPGDHAGICECSELEALFPGTIKLDRLDPSEDWFAETAADASAELGERIVAARIAEYLPKLRNET